MTRKAGKTSRAGALDDLLLLLIVLAAEEQEAFDLSRRLAFNRSPLEGVRGCVQHLIRKARLVSGESRSKAAPSADAAPTQPKSAPQSHAIARTR